MESTKHGTNIVRTLQQLAEKGDSLVFELGDILTTNEVKSSDGIKIKDIFKALYQYLQGDWGDTDPSGKVANDKAVQEGQRILAVYTSSAGKRFWIMTDAHRTRTTIALPAEYN